MRIDGFSLFSVKNEMAQSKLGFVEVEWHGKLLFSNQFSLAWAA